MTAKYVRIWRTVELRAQTIKRQDGRAVKAEDITVAPMQIIQHDQSSGEGGQNFGRWVGGDGASGLRGGVKFRVTARGWIRLGSDGSGPSGIGSGPGPGPDTLDPTPFRVRLLRTDHA